MIGFKLNSQTLRLAKAIGDDDVEYDHEGETQMFVYYERDDTFEIMSEKNYKRRFGGLRNNFPVMVFSYSENN